MAETLFGLGRKKLLALCEGLKVPEKEALEIFNLISDPWMDQPLFDAPVIRNDITDDGTPFEFSVAFNHQGARLRMLFEAQPPAGSRATPWEAGIAFHEKIRTRDGVDLSRFDRISGLFQPVETIPARFCIWHAIVMNPDGLPVFKVYLNPQVRGPSSAPALVKEALFRLNLEETWNFIAPKINEQNPVVYFSLDLSPSKKARVKLYLAHFNANIAEVETHGKGCRHYVPGDATRWITALTHRDGPFTSRPILSCYSFTSSEEAPDLTVHVPVRCYTDNDQQALMNAETLLHKEHYQLLRAALTQMAQRPLEMGRGLITYVSVRREAVSENVTFYLSPEAYAISAPRNVRTADNPVMSRRAYAVSCI